MINYKDEKLMKELKNSYDETLKRRHLRLGNGFNDNNFPYSPKYPHYYKRFILKNLIENMRKDVYEAYKNGAGHELDEGKNGTPPKMLSVGSSSAFCFTSLVVDRHTNIKEGADFFSKEGETIRRTYFEKVLPIFEKENIIPPHMDAYAKSKSSEYFFECKCHEMFDQHPLKLSKKYFDTDKDLIVDYLPKESLVLEKGEYSISEEIFGVKDTTFDIKQLLTHLMGIKCNKKMRESHLIYYYSFPEETDVDDSRLLEVMNKTKEDAVKIFESSVIKDYCEKNNIRLHLYIKKADNYASSVRNTIKIY